ncbi:MAG TPA: NADH-quinone oxidoreductase subunit A [Myxococcales bacterium]|nr:NADH-quinone oxidoreductase subunit A [Myxococcales bacterium]
MGAHYDQYIPIAVMLLVCCGMMGLILVLNSLVGPKSKGGAHAEPFECGSEPVGSARERFSVNFYLVAIFFIVFDIEAVFLYPWAVLYRTFLADPSFALIALVEMFVFIGVLFVGLIYVWKRGALDWT